MKLKLSSSISPACLMNFGFCLTHVPISRNDLSCKFQRSSLSEGLLGGSMLCFIGQWHDCMTHTFEKEARKL